MVKFYSVGAQPIDNLGTVSRTADLSSATRVLSCSEMDSARSFSKMSTMSG